MMILTYTACCIDNHKRQINFRLILLINWRDYIQWMLLKQILGLSV